MLAETHSCLEMPHFVYLVDGYFIRFPVFPITSMAAINIHIQISVWTCVFISLSKTRRSGVARLNGKFIFNFLRNCQTAGHNDLLSTFYVFTSDVGGLDLCF